MGINNLVMTDSISENYSIENLRTVINKFVKKRQIYYILFILQIPSVKIIHQV